MSAAPNVFHQERKGDDGAVFTVQHHLDTRGMTCPQPALKALERGRALKPGEVLEVVGDWPGSKLEVPFAVAERDGMEVLCIIDSDVPDDETWWIYIRRT